jgi:hypothetical protein
MNVEQNDITRIIGGQGQYTDRLVEVVRFKGVWLCEPTLGPFWFVKPIGFTPFDCKTDGDGCFLFPDARLRPIRDPGDDAVDEMVLRVGKPQEVTA